MPCAAQDIVTADCADKFPDSCTQAELAQVADAEANTAALLQAAFVATWEHIEAGQETISGPTATKR